MKFLFFITLFFTVLLNGCSSLSSFTPDQIEAESKKANAFFDQAFEDNLKENPIRLTYIGRKERYDELGDFSKIQKKKDFLRAEKQLQKLKTIKYNALNEATKLSYRLFKQQLQDDIKHHKNFYHNGYPLNQMHGVHAFLPSFMVNMHKVNSKQDALDYISRLEQFGHAFSETLKHMKEQTSPHHPNFIFDKVISDCKNVLSGQPFQKTKTKSVLYNDISSKVSQLKIKKSEKTALLKKAKETLNSKVKPAYEKVIAYMTTLKEQTKEAPKGLWAQPNGKDYYKFLLRQHTTTDLTPKEIHSLGLKEVKRLQDQILTLAPKLGLKANTPLKDIFNHIKKHPDSYYPNTKQGRQQYLKDTQKIISDMKGKLNELFGIKPKADLILKPVEPYREKSVGLAFYMQPPLEGKDRKGIYYVNLSDMTTAAKYDMEALAYHEAIPGHHMQLSIAQELSNLPKFRKTGGYNAYTEGWGLYAEYAPKESGFYKNPLSEFGRLSMELWRAVRLVVDTGIHYKKWSYDQTLAYMRANTPDSEDSIVKSVQRYFVYPGQANAYKIGQLKILELKTKAKTKLKDKFDIKKFHDTVLSKGAVPLYELEHQVNQWVSKVQFNQI